MPFIVVAILNACNLSRFYTKLYDLSKLIELGTKLRFYALRREEERNVGRVKRVCERQRQNSIHIITTISIHPLFHISCPISRSLYITLPLLHMLLAYDNMKKDF